MGTRLCKRKFYSDILMGPLGNVRKSFSQLLNAFLKMSGAAFTLTGECVCESMYHR